MYKRQIEDIQPEIWPRLFDPEFLRENRVVTATAEGRGPAYFFTWGSNKLVLRHYLRGGLLGKVVSDRYLGGSLESSRPYLEWKLLGKLVELGLPAPRPAARKSGTARPSSENVVLVNSVKVLLRQAAHILIRAAP